MVINMFIHTKEDKNIKVVYMNESTAFVIILIGLAAFNAYATFIVGKRL